MICYYYYDCYYYLCALQNFNNESEMFEFGGMKKSYLSSLLFWSYGSFIMKLAEATGGGELLHDHA